MFASRSSVRAAGALQSISSRIAIEPFVPVTYGSRQCLWRSHERWQASPGNVFSYGFSWRPSAHKPRVVGDFSSVIPPVRTKSDRPLEEETLPEYGPDDFYPIDPGTQINSRYRVIGKLGHGANSTVWLCRDLQYETTAALRAALSSDHNLQRRRTCRGESTREVSSEKREPGEGRV